MQSKVSPLLGTPHPPSPVPVRGLSRPHAPAPRSPSAVGASTVQPHPAVPSHPARSLPHEDTWRLSSLLCCAFWSPLGCSSVSFPSSLFSPDPGNETRLHPLLLSPRPCTGSLAPASPGAIWVCPGPRSRVCSPVRAPPAPVTMRRPLAPQEAAELKLSPALSSLPAQSVARGPARPLSGPSPPVPAPQPWFWSQASLSWAGDRFPTRSLSLVSHLPSLSFVPSRGLFLEHGQTCHCSQTSGSSHCVLYTVPGSC